MMLIAVAMACAILQDPGENREECKKALDTFHAATNGAPEPGKISAINELAHHVCTASVAAIAHYLSSESPALRIAAAKALGTMDHPKSVEALANAVVPSEADKTVFDAVVKAVEKVDYESGAESLHAVLARFHEQGMLDYVKEVIPVLGKLGSGGSVDPLLTLLEHVETESKGGRVGKVRTANNTAQNKALAALAGPIKAALAAITGGNQPNSTLWRDWWQANKESLTAGATIVYRCKLTGKRWSQTAGEAQSCPNHDKPEKDGQPVKVLLHSKT